jgi:hypothetical protein
VLYNSSLISSTLDKSLFNLLKIYRIFGDKTDKDSLRETMSF